MCRVHEKLYHVTCADIENQGQLYGCTVALFDKNDFTAIISLIFSAKLKIECRQKKKKKKMGPNCSVQFSFQTLTLPGN